MEKRIFKNFGLLAATTLITAFAACQNNDNKSADSKKSSDSTATAAVAEHIVYVNSDSLLTNYGYFKDLNTKFEGKSKSAQADLQSRGQSFQKEVAQYQQNANNLSADQRQATEERLARKQQELQTYQQNAAGALQNEQALENEKLYDKVADYLKGYAKQKGFKMVLTYSKGNSAILFADESLDVTQEVLKGLNEDYNKNKK